MLFFQVVRIRVLCFGDRPRIHSLERHLSLRSVLLLSLCLTSSFYHYSDRATTEYATTNLSNRFLQPAFIKSAISLPSCLRASSRIARCRGIKAFAFSFKIVLAIRSFTSFLNLPSCLERYHMSHQPVCPPDLARSDQYCIWGCRPTICAASGLTPSSFPSQGVKCDATNTPSLLVVICTILPSTA